MIMPSKEKEKGDDDPDRKSGLEKDSDNQKREQSKTHRSLRRAMWINTWVLLSLAIAHQKIETCTAAVSATTTNQAMDDALNLPVPVSSDESVDLEEWEVDLEQTWQGNPKSQSEDVIVVATVDGTLAGLSRRTGKTLWKQQSKGKKDRSSDTSKSDHMRPKERPHRDDSESETSRLLSPLVSTTTTTKSSSSSQDWRTAAVPSVDGRVYLTAGRGEMSSGSSPSDLSASTTVRELVGRAPFVDARGRFYVGSTVSTAAALDSETGEILRIVSPEQNQNLQETTLDGRNVVWLGRVDYSVSLFDARSGDADVEFSASEVMSVNDMMVGIGHRGHNQHQESSHLLPNGGSTGSDPFSSATKKSLLVATPSGNVALRDPDTGQIRWVAEESFDTPVAFAVDSSSGTSLGVDILPDAAEANGSTEYISQELERQMKEFSNSPGQGGPQTIVGALSTGQLYAMPLGRRSAATAHVAKHAHPLGLPHPHMAASSSSSLLPTKHSGFSSVAGRHASTAHIQDFSATHHEKRKRNCNPTSPGFPGCLVGPIHNIDLFGGRSDHDSQGSFLSAGDHALAVKQDGAVTIKYHPQFGYLQHEQDVQDLLNRKRSRTFSRFMSSWVPSTMVLLFLLSFELGRRQRQKRQAAANDARAELEEATSKMVSVNSSGDLIRNIGIIQVTEEVLGYGGHGTVVYKGMLEGRMVAVKRMLKTYHASADREISLLIESDGHPNVVRYFLKEVRGDFVYLALELCDLSLHDLIGRLNVHRSERSMQGAVRTTLLQVASGVRHLHSLRIVHRDLKPANILLAKTRSKRKQIERKESSESESNDSVYAHFEHGDYVAKISDMGLGKQLAGQSSFGLSTLGNASLTGASTGGASTIAGAGPGSVGWQAPEVMAQRWTPDVNSARSEASSQGQDSFADASPLDAAASTRTSRSADIFSLGCIFYCTLVPGSHPFGDWYEREANIMKNKPSIEDLDEISPDAYELVSSMIERDPKARPTARQICAHPFFWTANQRLAFLCDVSDRLESGQVSTLDGSVQGALNVLPLSGNSLIIERNAAQVVGIAWDKKLDNDLLDNVSRFRTYDPSSVRDCLRLIRNKHHHFDELPKEVKERIGSNPEGLLAYFEAQFPRLVMHCYSICSEVMAADDPIAIKYSIRTDTPHQRVEPHSISVVDESEEPADRSDPSLQQTTEPPSNEVAATTHKETEERDEILATDESRTACDTATDTLEAHAPEIGESVKEKTQPLVAASFEPEPAPVHVPANDAIAPPDDIIIWEGSAAANTFNSRGWTRSDDEWIRRTGASIRKKDKNVQRCAEDPKFRTRLCNHWDVSQGTFCPMRRKNKCVFAHGPIELRIKEQKRNRWGKLVDKNGNNANPRASGGEDTYGAARSIESARKEEGKWKTAEKGKPKGKQQLSGTSRRRPRGHELRGRDLV